MLASPHAALRSTTSDETAGRADLVLHLDFDANQTQALSGRFAGLPEIAEGLSKGMRLHVPPSQRHVLMRDTMGCLKSGDDAYSFDEKHLEQCTKQGVDQVRFERIPPPLLPRCWSRLVPGHLMRDLSATPECSALSPHLGRGR